MIFSTLNQVNCFLIFVFLGIIFSIIYDALFILFLKKHRKKFANYTFDTIFYAIFSCFFVIFKNIFNFGLFSFSLLLACSIGFVWTKSTTKNLVVFLEEKWYNKITLKRKEKRVQNASKSKEG